MIAKSGTACPVIGKPPSDSNSENKKRGELLNWSGSSWWTVHLPLKTGLKKL